MRKKINISVIFIFIFLFFNNSYSQSTINYGWETAGYPTGWKARGIIVNSKGGGAISTGNFAAFSNSTSLLEIHASDTGYVNSISFYGKSISPTEPSTITLWGHNGVSYIPLLTVYAYDSWTIFSYGYGTSLNQFQWVKLTSPDGAYIDETTINEAPNPVQMVSFNLSSYSNQVQLKWKTAFEFNNSGFEIYRDNLKIGFVKGAGTTNAPNSYQFNDKTNSGKHIYLLKQLDYNGNFEIFTDSIIVSEPNKTSFNFIYPNPTNGQIWISYNIDGLMTKSINVNVFDVSGRNLFSSNKIGTPGYYSEMIDISNLASGIYYLSFSADNYKSNKKFSIIK